MKFFSLIFLIFHSLGLYGQEITFSKKANNLIQSAIVENQTIGIVAGFSVDGRIEWQNGAGYSNLKDKVAFDTTTITRIASITKPMTAIAIMQLYENGKLELDIPIQTYLPTFPKKKNGEITIRHLLQHSSGIDAYKNKKEQENKKKYKSFADAVSIFKDRKLISTPGEEFNYSTYGYVLLGQIIEVVSGTSYEAYMQANIWDKANMSNTGIEVEGKSTPNTSMIYHRNSKGKIKEAKRTNLSDRISGGGVYSTVTDLLKFGDAVINNTLIKPSTFKMMTENPNIKTKGNAYGLGWYLYGKNPNYGDVFGHTGTQTGASTFLMLLPEQKTSIVVLANTSGAIQAVSNITISLFDIAHEAKMISKTD